MSEEEETNVDLDAVKKCQEQLASITSEGITKAFELGITAGKGFVHSAGVVFHEPDSPEQGTPVLSLTVAGPAVSNITKILREAGIGVQFDRVAISDAPADAVDEKEETAEESAPEEEAGEEPAT